VTLAETFRAEVVALLPNKSGQLEVVDREGFQSPFDDNEYAVAMWVFHHGQPAGQGTNTLSSAKWRFLPLMTADREVLGVIGIHLPKVDLLPDERLLLEAFLSIASLALRFFLGGNRSE
jgi:two-component system sensor histidine kinase KdpD